MYIQPANYVQTRTEQENCFTDKTCLTDKVFQIIIKFNGSVVVSCCFFCMGTKTSFINGINLKTILYTNWMWRLNCKCNFKKPNERKKKLHISTKTMQYFSTYYTGKSKYKSTVITELVCQHNFISELWSDWWVKLSKINPKPCSFILFLPFLLCPND